VQISARGYETKRVEASSSVTITLRRLGGLRVHVVSPDGAPIADATVVIGGARLWPARRTSTGADGVARISGLLGGSYDLRASRGSNVSETLYGYTLSDGTDDEVTLRLGPGRMLRVLVLDGEDEAALPVPGADVVLAEGGIGSFPMRGRANQAGEVLLGPIPRGPAAVGARADGFVPRSGVSVPESEDIVRVGLLRGATLAGRVVDLDGYPIAGASIEVVGSDPFGLPFSESPVLQSFNRTHFAWALAGPVALIPAGELGVMPGPVPPIPGLGGDRANSFEAPIDAAEGPNPWVSLQNGEFEAFPVTPGRVRALVRHPDFVEALSEEVSLTPGGRANVQVELFRGGTLEGRVLDDRNFPVAGASLQLRALKGTYERLTLSGPDGAFAFAAVPKQVLLSVAAPDAPTRTLLREHLEVTEGGRTEIALTLPARRPDVQVTIFGADDRPVAMAQVTIASLDPDVPRRETNFTDEQGHITLPDLGGLPLEVSVEAYDWAPTRLKVSEAPAELRVSLAHGIELTGRVTKVRGRFPVSSARVALLAGGQRRTTLTDEQGGYSFRNVPLGGARLSIGHPDYAEVVKDVSVVDTGRPDRPQELEAIDLAEPGSASGSVVDSKGNPVPGARVAVGFVPAYFPAGSLPNNVAVSGDDGRFSLPGIAAGSVELGAYAVDVGRGQLTGVRVEAGRDTAGLVLRLDQPVEEATPNTQGNVAITLGESGTNQQRSVVLISVAAGSEAERAGLAVNDALVSVDGQPVRDMLEARSLLAGPVGSHAVVELSRVGRRHRFSVPREQIRR
jgi:protocatechuate 3,4-dioxygenase beta subunit